MPESRGVASATVAAARNLGMVLGVAIAGALFNSAFYELSSGLSLKEYHPALEETFMESFRFVMMAGGLIAILGMIIAFFRGPEQTGPRSQRFNCLRLRQVQTLQASRQGQKLSTSYY